MTTLRYRFSSEDHMHLLHRNGREFPLMGCSTVVGVLNKGGLQWWSSGMACTELGWLNPKKAGKEERLQKARYMLQQIQEMSAVQYEALLQKAYRAHNTHKDDTAKEGTDTHKKCEDFINAHMSHSDWPVMEEDTIYPFVKWTMGNVKQFLWSEAHCYSETMWVGGICDAGLVMTDKGVAVLDFKRSKEAYTSQFIQAAGYALMIEENGLFDADGNQIKAPGEIPPIDTLIIVPFRSNPVTPAIVKGIGKFKEGFRSCVQLHKLVEGIQV